jgi:hypothetical protein
MSSSYIVGDKVSHQYETKNEVIVLYSLTFRPHGSELI